MANAAKLEEKQVFLIQKFFDFIVTCSETNSLFVKALKSHEKTEKEIFFSSLKKILLTEHNSPFVRALHGKNVNLQGFLEEKEDLASCLSSSEKSCLVFYKTFLKYFYGCFVQSEGYKNDFGLSGKKVIPFYRGEPIEGSKFEDPVFEATCTVLAYLQEPLPQEISAAALKTSHRTSSPITR